MKPKRIIKIIILFTGVISLLLSSCSQPDSSSPHLNSEELKIGAILPLTQSRLNYMGQIEKQAMLLAQNELKYKNNNITILFEDSQGKPNTAVDAAHKLIRDGVDILITSTTSASLAVAPITSNRKINLVAYCMDNKIADNSDYVVRLYEGIDEEATAITAYFAKKKQKGNVGILYTKVPVFEDVVENNYLPFLKDNEYAITYKESYLLNEKNFRPKILKLSNANIDYLILLGYGFEYQAIFKELKLFKQLGKFQIIGGWGFLYTKLDSELLEGVLVAGPQYVFNNNEKINTFFNSYLQHYNEQPNFDAAFAYNAIMTLGEYVDKEKIDLPLQETLKNIGQLDGVIGQFSISKTGKMIIPTSIGSFRNGKIVPMN